MIKIISEKAHGDYDPGTSKFFGSPTCPEEWLENGFIGDDDFFFCQLKIEEFKKFDTENLLPKRGFIYFFLSKQGSEYVPNVRYTETMPETIIDDFNEGFDFPFDITTEYSIDYEDDVSFDGTSLLIPDNDDIILLKYDPLDDNMPKFLSETEKTCFFRINKEKLNNLDFSAVSMIIE